MDYTDSYMFIEHEEQQNMYFHSEQIYTKVEIQKKICKKKYQKALKWAHLPSPFSENQTPEKFLLYGNVNVFTNYSEDISRCQYTSECLVENGYYKVDRVSVQEKKGIEVQVSQLKPCLDKFQFLINLFKRYQSVKYNELANTLLLYQKYIKQEFDRSNFLYKQLKKDSSLSLRFQEEFSIFEQKTISDIQAQNISSNNHTCFFSYQTVQMNYKQCQPQIKKVGTSEPLINLLGNSIQNEYQSLLLKMRKQSAYTKNQENHLFKSQESISKAIFMINNIISNQKTFTYTHTLMTRDGFEIACTVKAEIIQNNNLNYVKFYESKDQQVVLFSYSFNKNDIQALQNKRESMSQQTSSLSPKKYIHDISSVLDEQCQLSSNFNLDHTSETMSQNSILDFNNNHSIILHNNNNNQQSQLNHCHVQNTFIYQLKTSQSFSPQQLVSSTTTSFIYKEEQTKPSDYTQKSSLFINKYYKHLFKESPKLGVYQIKQHSSY